jgi:hypothetical protein
MMQRDTIDSEKNVVIGQMQDSLTLNVLNKLKETGFSYRAFVFMD